MTLPPSSPISKSFARQETRAEGVQSTGCNNQHPRVADAPHNNINAPAPQFRGYSPEHRALGAGNGCLYLAIRIPRSSQDSLQACKGSALEDGAGDGQADELALALGNVQELDGFGDAVRLYQTGSDRVSGLRGCHAQAQQDRVAVDVRDRRVCAHGVHRSAAACHENSTDEIPDHVVASASHRSAT